jgi:hypothetical protein
MPGQRRSAATRPSAKAAFAVALLCGCSHDEECIRRYLNEEREKWCFAERTMNGEEHEALCALCEEDGKP